MATMTIAMTNPPAAAPTAMNSAGVAAARLRVAVVGGSVGVTCISGDVDAVVGPNAIDVMLVREADGTGILELDVSMVMTELLLLALLQSQPSPEPETIVMLLFFFSIVSTSTAVLPASLIVL